MRARARVERLLLAFALVTVGASGGTVRADALDLFGFGARAESLAGALTADASGQLAAFYNPAGVARADDVEVAVGWGYGLTSLRLDGRDAGVTPPHGLSFGFSIPILLGPVRAAFGLAAYLPDQFVARIQTVPVAEPHFALLDNNPDRVVVTPVVSVRILRWLSVGAGATLLADAAGNGVDFTVGVVGGQKVGNASLDVALPIRAALVAGITLTPTPRMRIGLAYRGELDLGVRLDIVAHVDIAGAVTGDTSIGLRAVNHYTPQKATLGLAFDVTPSLTAMAELAWVNWAGFHGGTPDLKILLNLGVSPSLVAAMFPADHFKDTVVPRAGVEYRRQLHPKAGISARAGVAWEPSPVPDQTGLTSYADCDRLVLALGAGVQLSKISAVVEKPLRFDLAASWHELIPRVTEKSPAFAPGHGFSASGRIIHVSATLEARF